MKTLMGFRAPLRAVACACLALAVCACSKDEDETAPETKDAISSESRIPEKRPSSIRPGAKRGKANAAPKSKRPVSVTDIDERTDLSPNDRATLKLVEKAMEDEDIKTLRAALPAALKSPTAEVRSEAVDALGWFGARTMDDLLPFMADPDPDIAESALNNWTAALGEVEDEKRKCEMVEGVMRVLKNEDDLESLVIELNGCETILALQSVVNLIQCDNPVAVKVARDHYEFMTGDEFTTVEAANAWAQENCSDNEDN